LRTSPDVLTGDDGRFRFDELDAGTYHLTASCEDFAVRVVNDVATGREDVRIALAAGAVLSGRVTTAEDGAPVPAFSILARCPDRGRRDTTFFDAGGRYELRGLPVGQCSLRAAASGYPPSEGQDVVLTAESTARADFALETGGRVRGVVTGEDTGAPIAGARVELETFFGPPGFGNGFAAHATTDASGTFELDALAQGLRSITASADGYHTRIVSGLDVGEDEVGPVTITLAPVAPGEESKLELTGIGATLGHGRGGLTVQNTIPGGGALDAGVAAGDLIMAIDGESTAEMGMRDAIERIRGEADTDVRLTIRKAEGGEEVEITVTRRRLRTN
jgi:hypothetical protein